VRSGLNKTQPLSAVPTASAPFVGDHFAHRASPRESLADDDANDEATSTTELASGAWMRTSDAPLRERPTLASNIDEVIATARVELCRCASEVERSTTLEIVHEGCANFTRSFSAPLHGAHGGETNVSKKEWNISSRNIR